MAQRLTLLHSRLKAAWPALAFFGGFLWDAITLGRSISSLNLFLLLFYLTVAGVILVVMGRRGDPHGKPDVPSHAPGSQSRGALAGPDGVPAIAFAKLMRWIRGDGASFVLQFCYGSLFSALVVFYFLSSSYWPGFLIVIALVALLCLNEFLESHYHRFTLTWSLFGVCAILFLNFALPHLFRSIHPIWFYLSTSMGAGLVCLLKILAPKAKGSLWPTFALAAGLILLYICNAIPPVPLVKKNMVICRSLEKKGTIYTAKMEKPEAMAFWRRSDNVVRQLPGEKIFCFTSVFLPPGIQCTLYHRWMYQDPRTKAWMEFSRIGFPVHGGRHEGFRGFTYKRNLAPGRWEVRAETESGRVLGDIRFQAEASADSMMEYKNLVLR